MESRKLSSILCMVLALAALVVMPPLAGAAATTDRSSSSTAQSPVEVAEKAAVWVIDQAVPEAGGYKWGITQPGGGPFYQPTFGSGSAGIGTFFLELYRKTGDPTHLAYAEGAAQWAINKAVPSAGGYKWAMPDQDRSNPGWFLTSRGDGASSVGEFLLEMYRTTGNSLYLDYAEGAAQWCVASMVSENGGKYIEYNPDHQAAHGVQPGREAQSAAFLVHLYAETGDQALLDAAEETAVWLINSAVPVGADYKWVTNYPYAPSYTPMDAASIVGFFSELHEITGNSTYRDYADGGLRWIISQAVETGDAAKWPDREGGSTYWLVNGNLPGLEFVGTVLLDAYARTSNPAYLDYATKNANWIVGQALSEGEGLKYPASETAPEFCAWRNAVVADFLMDVYDVTRDSAYRQQAEMAVAWVAQEAISEGDGFKWTPCASYAISMGLYEAKFVDGMSGIGYHLLHATGGATSLDAIIDPIEAYPGDAIAVDLTIENADDLYAAQATCTVDPVILEPQSGTFDGSFFDPVDRLIAANVVSATTGTWLGAISQANPAGPLSGDGLFATVTYTATNPGTTAIACDPLLSDRDGFTQTVSFTGASVTVLPFATVNGTVQYQGCLTHAGIAVTATGTITLTTTTAASGDFVFDTVRAGGYAVRADAALYLPGCASVPGVDPGEVITLDATTLRGGDLNDDDVINIGDAAALGNSFGLDDPSRDINADGIVNVQDLAILGGNYEVAGCQAW